MEVIIIILLLGFIAIEVSAFMWLKSSYKGKIDKFLSLNIEKYSQAEKDRDSYRNLLSKWMNFALDTWDYELMARVVAAESPTQISKEFVASVILNRRSLQTKPWFIMDVLTGEYFHSMIEGEAYETTPTEEDYMAVRRAILKDYADGRTELNYEVHI